jgi:hypothetical protein
MSALGHKQTSASSPLMPAIEGKADFEAPALEEIG